MGFRNAALSPSFQRIFGRLSSLSLWPLLAGAAAALLLLLPARRSGAPVLFSVGVTGFAGMLLELVVVFVFQLRLGTVYQRVGAIIAAFMGGTAAGAAFSGAALRRARSGSVRAMLVVLDATVAAFSGLLALAAPRLTGGSAGSAPYVEALLLATSLVGGIAVGAQYPAAVALHRQGEGRLSRSVGLVGAADLCGGLVAGLAGGAILLPVLGLTRSCLILVAWEIAAALGLAAGALRPWGRARVLGKRPI
jgi:spermidine synthase